MINRKLPYYYTIYMGCDPEFFFSREGTIVGSERVLPENGLRKGPKIGVDGSGTEKYGTAPTAIVRDGVQAELNPRPNTCRANLANEIAECFRQLSREIQKDKSLKLDFSQVVEVSKEEFDSLSDKSKEFGCAASKNIYTGEESKITVDPREYRYRSAGGHIHLGVYSSGDSVERALKKEVPTTVALLDTIVGNTCVLLDRNPWNIERRKVYGRAGEHRTPKHGLEYRTLSNFWLRSYPLMSFVFGMSRLAVNISANSYKTTNFAKEILELVSKEAIEYAINNNDYDVAYSNWMKIEDYIIGLENNSMFDYPLAQRNIKNFHFFLDTVREGGLEYWFSEDPFYHWINLGEGHSRGWENFLTNTVAKGMKNAIYKDTKLVIEFVDDWSNDKRERLKEELLKNFYKESMKIRFFGYRGSKGNISNGNFGIRDWTLTDEHPVLIDEGTTINIGFPKRWRKDYYVDTSYLTSIIKEITRLIKEVK